MTTDWLAQWRLGAVLDCRGLHRALPVAQKLLAFCESRYGHGSHQAATCTYLLAGILSEMGNYCEAERLLRRALEIYEKWLAPEARETLGARSALAVLLHGASRYSEAVDS